MKERLKELAEQAGVTFDSLGASYTYGSLPDFLERFAELVRQDETKACAKYYIGIMRYAVEQAVLKEREACAKIADDLERKEYEAIGDPRVPQFQSLIGKAIRARTT
jgi:hypothetical protein